MSGSSSVQNGANWGDVDVSSNTSTKGNGSTVRGGVRKNGGRNRGADKKNASIRLFKKSDVTDTYHVFYDNKKIITTVTIVGSEVDQWIANLYKEYQDKLDKLIVGLDIERNRSTTSEQNIAVLQLCVGRRCLVFQFLHGDDNLTGLADSRSLDDFLGDKRFTFVGAGIKGDAYDLWNDYDLKVAKPEELGPLAADKLRKSRLHKAGLKDLARDVLNLELPKRNYIRLSDWEREYLSKQQVEYACLDAYVSFKLGMDLIENRPDPEQYENSRTEKFSKEAKKVEAGKTKQQVPDKADVTNNKRSN